MEDINKKIEKNAYIFRKYFAVILLGASLVVYVISAYIERSNENSDMEEIRKSENHNK